MLKGNAANGNAAASKLDRGVRGGPAGVPKPLFWGRATNNPVFVPRSGLDRSASQFQVSGANLCRRLRFFCRGGCKNSLVLANVMTFVGLGVVRNGSNPAPKEAVCAAEAGKLAEFRI